MQIYRVRSVNSKDVIITIAVAAKSIFDVHDLFTKYMSLNVPQFDSLGIEYQVEEWPMPEVILVNVEMLKK